MIVSPIHLIPNPSFVKQSTITSVSSLCSTPVSWHGVQRLPSAASTNARFVMLLLPGTETTASTALVSGRISSVGG